MPPQSSAVAVSEQATTATGRKRAVTRAVAEVSHYLGNTPAVCRASYIDPRVVDRYRGGAPAFRDRAWERAFAETTLFTPPHTATFAHEQRLTVEGFLDRAMSVSFIAALPAKEQATVRAELLTLVPPDDAEVVLPYRCEVSWCSRSP